MIMSYPNIWTNYEFKDYLNVKENNNIILPKGVSISTMCANCSLGTNLDLNAIYDKLNLNLNDILTVKVNQDKIKTIIPAKNKKKRTTKRNTQKKTNPFYNQITIVMRVYEEDMDQEYYKTNDSDEYNSEEYNSEEYNSDDSYNKLTDQDYWKSLKKLNIKIFKNGSIQMSGVKNYNYTNRALNKLVYRLTEINDNIIIENIDNLGIYNFNIYMINSNYKIAININRKKLFDILCMKKIKSSYEKCIRACVIVKYLPKVKNDKEKEVSIFIFEKGNIIITGARCFEHIVESYNYINDIILEHIEDITKKDEDIEKDLILKLYDDIMKESSHKFNN